MNPTVSVIVPVYNAHLSLRRCVESVLGQEYTDFELLLVDDGSTDGSGAICDEFAAADRRVRCFHKENSGVSDSRNLALDAARGTYLQFLDSDDWITPNATSLLVRAAEERACDLVISDFYRVVGDRVSPKGDIDESEVLTREEYAAHMMENPADFYYGVLWNKLYRREIVERSHLRMDPDISWCEDFMFNLEYIRCAERFLALQVPLYYYVKTKGSLASQGLSISKTIRMKLSVFEYYHRFYKTVLPEEEYEKSRLKVYKFLFDAAQDGVVSPFPGATRLGDERVQVEAEALFGEGPFCDAFRERKLLDYYLEPVALIHSLTLAESRLLLQLRCMPPVSRKDLADFCHLSRSALSLSLQKLAAKGILRIEEVRAPEEKEKKLQVTLLPGGESVLSGLEDALAQYTAGRLSGFTPEEQGQYEDFSRRVQANIQDILS